jgi:hypothetical protein
MDFDTGLAISRRKITPKHKPWRPKAKGYQYVVPNRRIDAPSNPRLPQNLAAR